MQYREQQRIDTQKIKILEEQITLLQRQSIDSNSSGDISTHSTHLNVITVIAIQILHLIQIIYHHYILIHCHNIILFTPAKHKLMYIVYYYHQYLMIVVFLYLQIHKNHVIIYH